MITLYGFYCIRFVSDLRLIFELFHVYYLFPFWEFICTFTILVGVDMDSTATLVHPSPSCNHLTQGIMIPKAQLICSKCTCWFYLNLNGLWISSAFFYYNLRIKIIYRHPLRYKSESLVEILLLEFYILGWIEKRRYLWCDCSLISFVCYYLVVLSGFEFILCIYYISVMACCW